MPSLLQQQGRQVFRCTCISGSEVESTLLHESRAEGRSLAQGPGSQGQQRLHPRVGREGVRHPHAGQGLRYHHVHLVPCA